MVERHFRGSLIPHALVKGFYESRIQKGGGCGMSVYCVFYFVTLFNFIFSFLLFRWRSYFKGKAVGKERFQ